MDQRDLKEWVVQRGIRFKEDDPETEVPLTHYRAPLGDLIKSYSSHLCRPRLFRTKAWHRVERMMRTALNSETVEWYEREDD